MAGGGIRKDDSVVLNSTNVFTALGTLRKKKFDKEQGSSKEKLVRRRSRIRASGVFWAHAPLTTKSWADVDDDDDYYATSAPLQTVWAGTEGDQTEKAKESLTPFEESESEEGGRRRRKKKTGMVKDEREREVRISYGFN